MRIPWTNKLCKADCVGGLKQREFRRARHSVRAVVHTQFSGAHGVTRPAFVALVVLLVAAAFSAAAQTANSPATTNVAPTASPALARTDAASQGFDESAFRIVPERNIFNANRSGGRVVLRSDRPPRVETFSLVGTMAYEKGVFAFFDGSSSEFSKVLKANSVIAGHKIVDIYANSVKLEADGKHIELPVGSQMRREDEGTWHLAQTSSHTGGSSSASSRNDDSANRSSRSDRSRSDSRSRRDGESSRNRSETAPETANRSSSNPVPSPADQAEILKRLQERREKESP